MKAKTKFNKIYNQLPEKARRELVYNFAVNPMTLQVCFMEIKQNTKLGKEILKELGFKDEYFITKEAEDALKCIINFQKKLGQNDASGVFHGNKTEHKNGKRNA